MEEIKLISTPNQELLVVLDKQNCTLQLRQLDKFIYLTLTVGQELICENAIIVLNTPIIQVPTSFVGNFVMLDDLDGLDSYYQPDWRQLGTRFKLYWDSAI